MKSGLFNSWGLNPLMLTPESNDQKLEVLTDSFSTFESIFENLDITYEEKYKVRLIEEENYYIKSIFFLWNKWKLFLFFNNQPTNHGYGRLTISDFLETYSTNVMASV